MSDEMVVPEWAGDLREKMGDMFREVPDQSSTEPVRLVPVTDFSTFFAEHTTRDSDVIIHFFPRAGEGDQWTAGHYLNRCQKCRRELSNEEMTDKKPCPECGSIGRVYVPGRRESKAEVAFDDGIRDLIKKAVDSTWEGDVAIEQVEELGAFVVQLQGAKNTASVVGGKFVDKICEGLDALLEPERAK